jgi:hypothetical protein
VTTGTAAAFTVTLASNQTNGLAVSAFLLTGSSAVLSDIMKQESAHRYMVRNGQGKGRCKLVAKSTGTLVAGEMNLIATDSAGGTYYVTKLTARRANLVAITGTQFTNGVSGWNMTTAVANVSVTVANN